MKLKLYAVILAFSAAVIYFAMDHLMVEHPAVKVADHDELIMYSITGCSACAEKRRELRQAEIPYVERVVDRQPGAGEELKSKLSAAQFPATQVGYPSFDVKGTLIPNNPPLFQIKKHLEEES